METVPPLPSGPWQLAQAILFIIMLKPWGMIGWPDELVAVKKILCPLEVKDVPQLINTRGTLRTSIHVKTKRRHRFTALFLLFSITGLLFHFQDPGVNGYDDGTDGYEGCPR